MAPLPLVGTWHGYGRPRATIIGATWIRGIPGTSTRKERGGTEDLRYGPVAHWKPAPQPLPPRIPPHCTLLVPRTPRRGRPRHIPAPRPPAARGRAGAWSSPSLSSRAAIANQRAAFRREGEGGRKCRSLPVVAGTMSEGWPLRLLALHGYRQSERRFRQRTGALRKALRGRAELVALDAPHLVPGTEDEASDDPPRGWWFSRPGTFEASEAADQPAGLEESLEAVARALEERGPFDGLLGFSQGAALAAMVCALRARGDPRFPITFAILVAAFASRAPAHDHFYREPIALPSLHVVGDADAVIAARLSAELAQCFVEPVVITHPGGHFVPVAAPQKEAYLDFLGRFRPGQGRAEQPGAGAV